MLAIVGTVPDENFPLVVGEVSIKDDKICIGDITAPINRGTPALIAAALKTCEVLGLPRPLGFIVGDIGTGKGSRLLYKHLEQYFLNPANIHTIVFHYLQPDTDWHNRVLFSIQKMTPQPILIADAGFMYAAKMSGMSQAYDLFTPDAGELAFLADEEAPHPFYTRGFILHEEKRIPELIARAYEHNNAAKHLLVKGEKDYIVSSSCSPALHWKIFQVVAYPCTEALEAVGGTGDTLTGIASALISSGMGIAEGSALAARVNRLAGYYARSTPATQVMEIISQIPAALKQ